MAHLKVIIALSAVLFNISNGAYLKNSDLNDAKFFWNSQREPHNAVRVVANVSAKNGSEKIGLNSLSPDKDKTEMFVDQYHLTDSDIEDAQTSHVSDTSSWGTIIPSFKLPSFLKKKTITLTTTLLQKQTRYNTVYPSCLLLQNVKSICNGVLKTILPTRMKPTADIWDLLKTAMESIEKNKDAEIFIRPSSTMSIEATSTISLEPDQKYAASKDVFSSELNFEEDQKSESSDNSAKATPILSPNDGIISSQVDDGRMVPFLEPEIHFVTKYLTLLATETRLNTAHTATVIAQNCLPPDVQIPLCSGYSVAVKPIRPSNVHPLTPSSYPLPVNPTGPLDVHPLSPPSYPLPVDPIGPLDVPPLSPSSYPLTVDPIGSLDVHPLSPPSYPLPVNPIGPLDVDPLSPPSYPLSVNPIGPFDVHPLSPYSPADSQWPEQKDYPLGDITKYLVDEFNAHLRDVEMENAQRIFDETGQVPPVFREFNLPGFESPVFIRVNRSVKNDSHPAPPSNQTLSSS